MRAWGGPRSCSVLPTDDSVAPRHPNALKLASSHSVAAKPGQAVAGDELPVGSAAVAVNDNPMIGLRSRVVNDDQNRSVCIDGRAELFERDLVLMGGTNAASPQCPRNAGHSRAAFGRWIDGCVDPAKAHLRQEIPDHHRDGDRS